MNTIPVADFVRVLTGLSLLIAFTATAGVAQTELAPNEGFGDRPRVGIGYVVSAPNMYTGASLYGLFDVLGGIGLYVDAKLKARTPADEASFEDTLTTSDAEILPGQRYSREEFGWWSVNAAILRPLSPEMMVYLGAGYTMKDRYARYRDTTESFDLGTLGWYWVHDPQASGPRLNLLGGVFFRLTRHAAVQFGAESAPGGFTVGGSFSFGI